MNRKICNKFVSRWKLVSLFSSTRCIRLVRSYPRETSLCVLSASGDIRSLWNRVHMNTIFPYCGRCECARQGWIFCKTVMDIRNKRIHESRNGQRDDVWGSLYCWTSCRRSCICIGSDFCVACCVNKATARRERFYYRFRRRFFHRCECSSGEAEAAACSRTSYHMNLGRRQKDEYLGVYSCDLKVEKY